MKQIMMLLSFGWLFFFSQLEADEIENNPFVYFNTGFIGGYPVVGAGYRNQYKYQGYDISGKIYPRVPYTPVAKIHGHYLLYPKQKSFYIGGGFGYIWEGEVLRTGSVSIDAVLGYQWETKKGEKIFFEVESMRPLKDTCCPSIWPGLTLGISF